MPAETILSPNQLAQLWADFAKDENLPDYYELTEHGEVVLSPRPETRHQRICASIAYQLQHQLGGEAVYEVAVLTTTAGIRVPDIVWMPQDKWKTVSHATLIRAPNLVVEVLSPGNRETEMNHKIQAYLASGVQEVLVVDLTGKLTFYHQDGVHATSMSNVTLSLPNHLFS